MVQSWIYLHLNVPGFEPPLTEELPHSWYYLRLGSNRAYSRQEWVCKWVT